MSTGDTLTKGAVTDLRVGLSSSLDFDMFCHAVVFDCLPLILMLCSITKH